MELRSIQSNPLNGLSPAQSVAGSLKGFSMGEAWKEIDGYPNYWVSDAGRIKSKSGKILNCCPNNRGYILIRLVSSNQAKTFRVHRLVAKAFLPDPDISQSDVNHINGVKTDNKVSNLEWVNRRENVTHAYKKLLTGAWFDKYKKCWVSSIALDGKKIHIGHYHTQIEASLAYNKVIKFLGLENRYAQ